jgi:hypothetical protein
VIYVAKSNAPRGSAPAALRAGEQIAVAELNERQEALLFRMSDVVARMGVTAGTRAQDFITITNGAAALACLGLMGSSSPYANSPVVRVLLAMFVSGLVLAGVTVVRGYRFATKVGWAFNDAARRLGRGEATFADVLTAFDMERAKALFTWNTVIGAISLGLFAAGAIGACVWLIVLSYCRA